MHRLCKSLNTGRICANNRNSRASVAKQEEDFLLFLYQRIKKLVLCTDRVSSLLSFQNRDFIVYSYKYQAALEGQFGEVF